MDADHDNNLIILTSFDLEFVSLRRLDTLKELNRFDASIKRDKIIGMKLITPFIMLWNIESVKLYYINFF